MNHTYKYISHITMALLAVLFLSCSTTKNTGKKEAKVKAAVVSAEQPFQETLMFPFDDKGLNLNVNMSFDEASNILTLSLKGNRQLMVFRKDTYYNKVFSHKFPIVGSRKMHPQKLAYPVLVRPNVNITLTDDVWKTFSKKRSRHLFNCWLSNVSPEMTIIQPSIDTENPEATLIVDSVVQRFQVGPNTTKASFLLRNLLVVDQGGKEPLAPIELKRTSKKVKYQIVNDNDLNLTYNVQLQRNPCFATEALQDSINKQIAAIKTAYGNLHKACPEGKVDSKKAVGIFRQHRQYLLSRFQCYADSSKCADVQALYDEFNAYVDSIKNAPCLYIPTNEGDGVGGAAEAMPRTGVRPDFLLDSARRIDNIVAQLMVVHDGAQIHDLTQTGSELIRNINKSVREKGLINDEQKRAYNEYRKAQNYFNSIVIRQ